MRIHLISCQVFYRELSALCAVSPNTTTVSWLPQGLHDTPDLLRKSVAEEIQRAEAQAQKERHKRPDYIVTGYGLCSNGTVGLQSGEIPLVIPRTDDCIGVFLGSQQRYLSLFKQFPGTYWLNNGWLESAFLPTAENYNRLREFYLEEYGEENADFLMENAVAWIQNYQNPAYEEAARQMARQNGWSFRRLEGDNTLLQRMVNGPFDEESFLVCPPHSRVEACYDGRKIIAVPQEGENILPKR